MSRFRSISAAVAALLMLGAAPTALAQGGGDPSRVERSLLPPPQRVEPPPALPTPVAPPEGRVEAGPLLTIAAVRFDGMRAFAPDRFAELTAPLLGRPVPLSDWLAVADAVTAVYRSAGYILSQAVLPPQTVTDGTLRIVVVEGRVDRVKLEGADRLISDPDLIRALAAPIGAEAPARLSTMESRLLRIGDLPGVTVRSVLEPSPTEVGAADMTLLVEERRVELGVEVNNRGSRDVGPERIQAFLAINSPLSLSDRLTVSMATTRLVTGQKSLDHGAADYDLPVGNDGTRLALGWSRTDTVPAGTLRTFLVEGEGQAWTAMLSHPLTRGRALSVHLRAGMEHRDVGSDLLGTAQFRDRLRVVRAGIAMDRRGAWGQSLLDLEVSQGLGILDATRAADQDKSRLAGSALFTRVTLLGRHVLPLGPEWALVGMAGGQWSPDRLLSSVEYVYGGPQFGRGYDAGVLSGDSGASAMAELVTSRPVTVAGQSLQLEAFGFIDGGVAWRRAEGTRATAASLGAGLRLRSAVGLSAELEVAAPIGEEGGNGGPGPARVFYRVRADF